MCSTMKVCFDLGSRVALKEAMIGGLFLLFFADVLICCVSVLTSVD